jgi:inosine triphosphate pyrophosphatase
VREFHKLLAGFEDKSAQAVCTFSYCEGPGKEPIVFQGRTEVGVVGVHRWKSGADVILDCRA